jgi:hypothetical protein
MRRLVGFRLLVAMALSGGALVPGLGPLGGADPVRAVTATQPDFNGDGYADLAVGSPTESDSRGVVHVLYGSATGPRGTGSIGFGEDTPGVPGTAAPGDQFGAFLAHGNVNGDAYDDLVVANPLDEVGGKRGAGSVTLFRGSATGLNLNGRMFTDAFGPGTVRAEEYFGNGIALGDYDGNGTDDIAIGTPLDSFRPDRTWNGSVKVLLSQAGGFSESRVWVLDKDNLPSTYRSKWVLNFGNTLSTLRGSAAFDGLAIGIAAYSNGSFAQGAVATFRGSGTSMRFADFFQGPFGTETFYGGMSLAAGDLSGDGNDDLVVGVPDAANGQGRVDVIPLARDRSRVRNPIHLSSNDAGHTAVSGDYFGLAVAIVDDGTDAYLYIGAPYDEAGGRQDSGSAYIFVGNGANKPTPHSTPRITQPNGVRNGLFGYQITALDASNDGFDDVVITSMHTVAGRIRAGAAWYYDSDDGAPDTGTPTEFNQNTIGIPGTANDNDRFGATLAST